MIATRCASLKAGNSSGPEHAHRPAHAHTSALHWTLRRWLGAKVAVKKPLLGKLNWQKRLSYVTSRKTWIENKLKQVWWSDNSKILIFGLLSIQTSCSWRIKNVIPNTDFQSCTNSFFDYILYIYVCVCVQDSVNHWTFFPNCLAKSNKKMKGGSRLLQTTVRSSRCRGCWAFAKETKVCIMFTTTFLEVPKILLWLRL